MFRELTAAQRKLIASLQKTKYRREHGLFVVEGGRSLSELQGCFNVKLIAATDRWLKEQGDAILSGMPQPYIVRPDELNRMSGLATPQGVLAVCEIPAAGEFNPKSIRPDELIIALDCVQDPGNLGTIIRTADWFGVTSILASADTADCFSPKVVQSTMGALGRVKIFYCDLPATLGTIKDRMPVYGTFLGGEDLYTAPLSSGGIILMGNEGNGIGEEAARCVTRRLTIPPFPQKRSGKVVQSLNVAMATGIILSEFRRRNK